MLIGIQILGKVDEKIVVEGFADDFEDAGVNFGTLKKIVTGWHSAVDLVREPHLRASLPL